MSQREGTALGDVYAAKTPDELAAAYARWGPDYDADTLAKGYCLPFVIAAWIARHVPKGNGPLLDAGCGTGLSAPCLHALGYEDIVGLDFSEEMLRLAARRGVYSSLAKAALGDVLPFPDRRFAAFFATGVFTEGHAPASSLDELVRVTRPHGRAIFTVRDTVLETGSFPDVFEWLEKAERWRRRDESEFFRAFAIGEPDVLVKTFVFEVL